MSYIPYCRLQRSIFLQLPKIQGTKKKFFCNAAAAAATQEQYRLQEKKNILFENPIKARVCIFSWVFRENAIWGNELLRGVRKKKCFRWFCRNRTKDIYVRSHFDVVVSFYLTSTISSSTINLSMSSQKICAQKHKIGWKFCFIRPWKKFNSITQLCKMGFVEYLSLLLCIVNGLIMIISDQKNMFHSVSSLGSLLIRYLMRQATIV